MAPPHGLTLCCFAESWGWGLVGGMGGTDRVCSGHEHPHHPHPAQAPVSAPTGTSWEDGGPKWLLERSAGLTVLELTGPGRDLVI